MKIKNNNLIIKQLAALEAVAKKWLWLVKDAELGNSFCDFGASNTKMRGNWHISDKGYWDIYRALTFHMDMDKEEEKAIGFEIWFLKSTNDSSINTKYAFDATFLFHFDAFVAESEIWLKEATNFLENEKLAICDKSVKARKAELNDFNKKVEKLKEELRSAEDARVEAKKNRMQEDDK